MLLSLSRPLPPSLPSSSLSKSQQTYLPVRIKTKERDIENTGKTIASVVRHLFLFYSLCLFLH